MRFGRLGIPAAVAVVVTALMGLAGCTATVAPTRTTPNQVERDAVQAAVGVRSTGTINIDIPWRQLWTIEQFPKQLKNCAAEASHGQLEVNAGAHLRDRLEYHIVGSGSEPNEVEAGRIIDACRAQLPVDVRILKLPSSDVPALYSYDLTVLRSCLISHGYEVSQPPSRTIFEEMLRNQTPWSPYDTVIAATRASWYAVSDACPAFPPNLVAAIAAR